MIAKLSELLERRNALELEALRVQAEIDAITGAVTIKLQESHQHVVNWRPPGRPDPLPSRIEKYLR